METDISKATRRLISQKALELFSNSNDYSPNDDTLQERLIGPLESIWRAGEIHGILQSNSTATNFCGKVFKNGEPAVFCKYVLIHTCTCTCIFTHIYDVLCIYVVNGGWYIVMLWLYMLCIGY